MNYRKRISLIAISLIFMSFAANADDIAKTDNADANTEKVSSKAEEKFIDKSLRDILMTGFEFSLGYGMCNATTAYALATSLAKNVPLYSMAGIMADEMVIGGLFEKYDEAYTKKGYWFPDTKSTSLQSFGDALLGIPLRMLISEVAVKTLNGKDHTTDAVNRFLSASYESTAPNSIAEREQKHKQRQELRKEVLTYSFDETEQVRNSCKVLYDRFMPEAIKQKITEAKEIIADQSQSDETLSGQTAFTGHNSINGLPSNSNGSDTYNLN